MYRVVKANQFLIFQLLTISINKLAVIKIYFSEAMFQDRVARNLCVENFEMNKQLLQLINLFKTYNNK
jgi:hypothetical protein